MVTEIFDKSYVYVQAALPCTPKCLFCFYAAKWWPRHFHRGNFYNRTKLDRRPTTMHLESQLRKKIYNNNNKILVHLIALKSIIIHQNLN